MRRFITVVLLSIFVWACNNHTHYENKEAISPSESDHQHEIITEKLVLNNGAKWKADSSTNNNVKNLQVILENFNNGADKSLAAYKKDADDLQKGMDKMISECKMKGPDHDALHKWLEPLIEQAAKLKQASTEAGAAKLFEAIHAQVIRYTHFFE